MGKTNSTSLGHEYYEKLYEVLLRLADKGISNTPQSWDLYREVQRFWDQDMRPPAGVTKEWVDCTTTNSVDGANNGLECWCSRPTD